MTDNKTNVTILLDRLYNLKGEDNVLIKELEGNLEELNQRIQGLGTQMEQAENDRIANDRSLNLFFQQKATIENLFNGFNNESFSELSHVGVELEVGTIVTTIAANSPEYIQSKMDAIEGFKRTRERLGEEKAEAEAKAIKLAEEIEKHKDFRTQLVSLLEQSLSPNDIERDSLTASYVKKIVIQFDIFTPVEVASLTKLIMFPDDGLFEYDNNYEERVAKGLIGVVEEATLSEGITEGQTIVINPVTPEETKTGVKEIGDNVPFDLSTNSDTETVTPDLEENGQVVATTSTNTSVLPIVEEDLDEEQGLKVVGNPVELNIADFTDVVTGQKVSETSLETIDALGRELDELLGIASTPTGTTTETVEEHLEDKGEVTFDREKALELLEKIKMDVNKFTDPSINYKKVKLDAILQLIAETDEKVVTDNFELLRSINLDDEAYKVRWNHMYLTDPELNKKITLLRAKSISEDKIRKMIKTTTTSTNRGLRIPFKEFEQRIASVENLHGKVDDSNIYLISQDLKKYEENIDTLITHGIDIDDKEARNHTAVLFESMNIPENMEILKNYLLKIEKSNGKYALSVFWKKPLELLEDIDALAEAGLEEVVANHPEVLTMNAQAILRRLAYCKAHGIEVFANEEHTELETYIINAEDFKSVAGYEAWKEVSKPTPVVNAGLGELLQNPDYVDILLNTLNEYYATTTTYATPVVEESMKESYEKLSHFLEEQCKATPTGKYTYTIDGVSVCKNKFERNLAIIINALAVSKLETTGVEKEIALVSALYNSHMSTEDLQKIVGSCLGFSKGKEEVITL